MEYATEASFHIVRLCLHTDFFTEEVQFDTDVPHYMVQRMNVLKQGHAIVFRSCLAGSAKGTSMYGMVFWV